MADKLKPFQLQFFTLAGAGVSLGDSSMTLSSFNDIDGNPIVDMSKFGTRGFMTIEPGALQQEEQILFTGVTPNLDGTTTLTGVSNVDFGYPYTETANFSKSHAGGVKAIVSNTSGYYNTFANKDNEETITEKWTYNSTTGANPVIDDANYTQTDPAELVHKQYVDNIAGGGTIPAVIVDSNSGSSGLIQVASLSYDVTISGINRGIFVQVSTQEDVTITVDIGGTNVPSVQSITDVPNNLRQEMFFLVAPALGLQTITITPSAPAYIASGAQALTGVDQSNPLGTGNTASGVDNSPTVSITTSYTNSLVFDGVCTNDTPPVVFTLGAGQSNNWQQGAGTYQGASSVEPAGTAPDSITNSYTLSGATPWVMSSLEIGGIASSIASLEVQQEGVTVLTDVSVINVTGNALVTTPGAGQVDIDILSGGGGGGGGGTKIAIDTTATSFGGGTPGTAYTVNIPGGTLGTNNAIRFKMLMSSCITDSGLGFIIKYGGTTLGQVTFTNSISSDGAIVFGEIIANGATNAQKFIGTSLGLIDTTGTIKSDTQYDGASTVDSTIDQDLVIEVNPSGTSSVTTQAIIVESITSTGIKVAKVTIPSADILTLNTTPIELVPAPASGHFLDIISVVGRLVFNTTAYTTNLNLQVSAGGTPISSNSDLLADTSTTIRKFLLDTGTLLAVNAINIDVQTGDPVAGDSDIDIYITYRDVEL